MSAIGLPMDGHVEPHFDEAGLCWCPCDECTTRLAKFCVCEFCSCDEQEDHQGACEIESVEWITVPLPSVRPPWIEPT